MGGLPTEFFQNIQRGLGGVGPGLVQRGLLEQQFKQQEAERLQKQQQFDTEQLNKLLLGTTTVLTPEGEEKGKIIGKTTVLPQAKTPGKAALKRGEFATNFRQRENSLRLLAGLKKSSLKELKGGGTFEAIKAGFFGRKLKLREGVGLGKFLPGQKRYKNTIAFENQRNETAAKIFKMISGQNRVVKDIWLRIASTLPESGDVWDVASGQLAQSLRSAYGLWRGAQAQGISTDPADYASDEEAAAAVAQIKPLPLTEKEEQSIQRLVNSVINTPPLTADDVSKIKLGTSIDDIISGKSSVPEIDLGKLGF